jgi:hypothetical protein
MGNQTRALELNHRFSQSGAGVERIQVRNSGSRFKVAINGPVPSAAAIRRQSGLLNGDFRFDGIVHARESTNC